MGRLRRQAGRPVRPRLTAWQPGHLCLHYKQPAAPGTHLVQQRRLVHRLQCISTGPGIQQALHQLERGAPEAIHQAVQVQPCRGSSSGSGRLGLAAVAVQVRSRESLTLPYNPGQCPVPQR